MGPITSARDAVAATNMKSDDQFIQENLRPTNDWSQWTHPKSQEHYSVSLAQARNMSLSDLKLCLGLIEETSRSHYEASSRGWNPRKKLIEMKEAEMRYIVVKDSAADVRGFTSLMPTYEEGEPVIYCYEIHLKPEMKGTGLGRLLMAFQERIARHTPTISKVMLTCFTRNNDAFEFYKKLGFDIDPISPVPRKLRFGKESPPDYVIMSKTVD